MRDRHQAAVSSVRYRYIVYIVARLTLRYLAMSLAVCPSDLMRFAVAMCSATGCGGGSKNSGSRLLMSGCPDRATLDASTPHFACAGGVVDMVSGIEDRDVASADVATLPLAPRNPLPMWRQLTAARAVHTGPETLRHAG